MAEGEGTLLLDTHALVWTAAGTIEPPAADAIVAAAQLGGVLVSSISAWELGLLARPRAGEPRIRLTPTPEAWFDTLLAQPGFTEAPLTVAIALAASRLPGDFHHDPADRLLVATARELNVPLVTRDERILAYGKAGHVATIAC
ncbi:MAG: type II toxin-antitoxin system VapC family toxin [Allosphingosinicella sp.]